MCVWLSPGSMESQLGVVPPAEKSQGIAQLLATETETPSMQNTVPPSRNMGVPLKDVQFKKGGSEHGTAGCSPRVLIQTISGGPRTPHNFKEASPVYMRNGFY